MLIHCTGEMLMSTVITIPIQSEILTPAELADITGCKTKDKQIEWLTTHGWSFFRNAGGRPIVGRYYARMALAGVRIGNMTHSNGEPNFDAIK